MARAELLFLIIPIAIGCQKDPGGGPASVPADQSELREWQKKFGMPIAIGPEEFPFTVSETRESFLKAHRAAHRIAGAGWSTPLSDQYRYAYWNSGTSGYRQNYAATWKSVGEAATGLDSKRPKHTITISTELYDKPRSTYHFSLHAVWESELGWGASINFYRGDGPINAVDSFSIGLFHPVLQPRYRAGKPASPLVLGAGRANFNTTRRDDEYLYEVDISSRPLDPKRPLPQSESIQQYWSSPESFREAALEELNRLEENVRRQIASSTAFEVKTKGGPTGADVPMPVPNNLVPDAVKQSVLDEALAEIETRRKLIQANYEAMHAATLAAFPELPTIVLPTPEK